MQADHVRSTKEGFVEAHFAFHLAGVADYALGFAVHNSWRGTVPLPLFFIENY